MTLKNFNKLFLIGSILFSMYSMSYATNIRFMDYNVLSYSSGDNTKDQALRTVIDEAGPDLFMAEEIVAQDGYNSFLANVLNYSQDGLFVGAPFTDQSASQDIALYYKPDLFTFISTDIIDITSNYGLRDAVEFVLRQNSSGVEIRLYGIHLKASSGSDNEATRAAETEALRTYLNTLPEGSNFFVIGDFNFYHSGELGFQNLIDSTDSNNGRVFDPVNRIGYWHNNSAYADVHTQSPRASFGGMDDRFDWIFTSASILSQSLCNYIPDTYQAFGNDGNHFNQGINEGNNTAVPANVADAMVTASDHIPVVSEFEFVDTVMTNAGIAISEVMPNPASVSDSYGEWFELANVDTVAYNLAGWTIADEGSDHHIIAPDNGELWIYPGDYLVLGRSADESSNGGVQVDYEYSGFLLSNTEDEIVLYNDQNEIVDILQYTSAFPFSSGVSMTMSDLSADNNDAANWSASTTPYGNGDLGTPGLAWDDSMAVTPGEPVLPEEFALLPAYPNPFNPSTTVPILAGRRGEVQFDVVNLIGQKIYSRDFSVNPGRNLILWDGSKASSGTYFVRVKMGNEVRIQKIILLK